MIPRLRQEGPAIAGVYRDRLHRLEHHAHSGRPQGVRAAIALCGNQVVDVEREAVAANAADDIDMVADRDLVLHVEGSDVGVRADRPVAGVGGGATFAALIVLPAMGLPVTLVALLISIEPLIDMGRTALNVNGSMTAGTATSQLLGVRNPDHEIA